MSSSGAALPRSPSASLLWRTVAIAIACAGHLGQRLVALRQVSRHRVVGRFAGDFGAFGCGGAVVAGCGLRCQRARRVAIAVSGASPSTANRPACSSCDSRVTTGGAARRSCCPPRTSSSPALRRIAFRCGCQFSSRSAWPPSARSGPACQSPAIADPRPR